MRTRWMGLVAVLGAACVPFVGSIDGDRFRCNVDDDCAGDGFVCVAGVCRDPRDLRLPDAGPTDTAVADGAPDAAAEAGVDAAAADAGPDASATDLGGADRATPDSAGADTSPPDSGAADQGLDAGASDSGALDAWTDSALEDLQGIDQAPVDAVVVDAATEDAATVDSGGVDAGEDAGPPCTQDSECSATGTSFCFSGRCAHLDVASLPTDLDQARMPSIGLVDGRRPAVAYYGYTATASNRKLGYYLYDGQAWQNFANVDTTDDVGAEPTLQFAPGGRPWIAYRKDTGDLIHLAHFEGISFQVEDLGAYGATDSDRAGLIIDPDGTQHVLLRDAVDGLMVGTRRPAAPDAVPLDPFVLAPSYLTGARWPALFRAPGSGDLYATFVSGDRPYLGMLLPDLGLVDVQMAANTQAGCTRLGITSNNSWCAADRPVDLAFDSQGGLHLCTHVKNSSSQYRLLYLWLADDGFHGVQLASNAEWDATYQPGIRCRIVVDALDVPHVFYNQGVTTTVGRLRHLRIHDHVPQTVGDADAPNDNGHWLDAVVDVDGVLHMAWTRVTARSSNQMSTSSLQVARLAWED